MTRLIVSNQLTEETAGGEESLPADYVQFLGRVAHRLVWLAREGDVVVLPSMPDEDFLDYVWRQLDIAQDAPRILVPPPGAQGDGLLYDDRLANPEFLRELRRVVVDHDVKELLAFFFDTAIARLATAVGLAESVSGFSFLTQGGNELVNSKSVFRAIAAGNGVAIPPGEVVSDRETAEAVIWTLLDRQRTVIVKQDRHGGGYGNEILSTVEGVDGFGALTTVTVPDRAALSAHLDQVWHRYTQGGRRPVVVEEYLPGSVPIYAELSVTGTGAELYGCGEMRMKATNRGPTNTGLLIPPPSATMPGFDEFLAGARRVGDVLHALGYRGNVSIDAIITPAGEILFNEFNSRVGGSTHVHHLASTLAGPGYLHDRVVVVRSRCSWSSVTDAAAELVARGLAFDRATRTGVLITGDDGQCAIVAEGMADARAVEDSLVDVLGLVAVQ
jgi:hypothetical protein